VTKRHRRFSCTADIYLDGSFIKRKILHKSDKMSSLTEDVLVGEHSVRPFLFGEVHLTGWYLSHCILEFIMNYYLDDESALSTRSYEELGTIKVKIHRITDCRSRRSSASAACFQVPENSKVHERAKKSATHQVM